MSDRDPDQESQWLKRVQETWDERSPWWDENSERNRLTRDRQTDLDRLLSALDLFPGDRLLDAGCGSGQFAYDFARRGIKVSGIDLAPQMIARAMLHAETAGLPIEFQVGSVTALPYPDESFDAIHARVVLQFPPNVPEALREFRRVLKKDGRLAASVPGSLSPIYGTSWERHLHPYSEASINYLTPWELGSLLESEGWTLIDGWGDFGSTPGGEGCELSGEELARLPLRLQQAAATTWMIVAAAPQP